MEPIERFYIRRGAGEQKGWFVVQRFVLLGCRARPTGEQAFETIEQARASLPPGAIGLGKSPLDTTNLIEVWTR